jgi:transcriptional regulator with XRE-family HTH domain
MAHRNSSQDAPQVPPQVLFGRTIRMMRQAHGVGLREMAVLVGVSPSHLSRVESGERAAGADLKDRLFDALATLPAPREAS